MSRLWIPRTLSADIQQRLRKAPEPEAEAFSRPYRRPETLSFWSTLRWFARWPVAMLQALAPATLRAGCLQWAAWDEVEQRYPSLNWWARTRALHSPMDAINRIRFGWLPASLKRASLSDTSPFSNAQRRAQFNPRELAFALSLLNPGQENELFRHDENDLTLLDLFLHGTHTQFLGEHREPEDLSFREDLFVAALTGMGVNPARFTHPEIFWGGLLSPRAIETLWSTPALDLSPSHLGEHQFLLHVQKVNTLFDLLMNTLLAQPGLGNSANTAKQWVEGLTPLVSHCIRGPWGMHERVSAECNELFIGASDLLPTPSSFQPSFSGASLSVGEMMSQLIDMHAQRASSSSTSPNRASLFFEQALAIWSSRVEREALASHLTPPATALTTRPESVSKQPSPNLSKSGAQADSALATSTSSDSTPKEGVPLAPPASSKSRTRRL